MNYLSGEKARKSGQGLAGSSRACSAGGAPTDAELGTAIRGIVQDRVVVPAASLPEGALVEIRLLPAQPAD